MVKQEPSAAYSRAIAAQIREFARTVELSEVSSEMVDLAERFERMAAYVEKRYPNRRGRPLPDP